LISSLLPSWLSIFFLAMAASTLLAQRSLHDHVEAVATALDLQGLDEGRRKVAMIVGRDPQALDCHGVSRAAIESLSENFSDGVVAPALWLAIGGLPGAAVYKAVNTADSMVGHKSERYMAFGWSAARLDDLANLPASRLAAIWIILSASLLSDCSGRSAIRAVCHDASLHKSPNAGWPEAAMAWALEIRLAGPRVYNGVAVEDNWMGNGRKEVDAYDIRRALRVYRTACAMQLAVLAAAAMITSYR